MRYKGHHLTIFSQAEDASKESRPSYGKVKFLCLHLVRIRRTGSGARTEPPRALATEVVIYFTKWRHCSNFRAKTRGYKYKAKLFDVFIVLIWLCPAASLAIKLESFSVCGTLRWGDEKQRNVKDVGRE